MNAAPARPAASHDGHYPDIQARVAALGLLGSDGRPLTAESHLYHNTAAGNVASILEHGLRSAQFRDDVDESQQEAFGELSVIWFTDDPDDFHDEGRPAQFRARLGDLVAHLGDPIDPGQAGAGRHLMFAVENTRRVPGSLTFPADLLDLIARC